MITRVASALTLLGLLLLLNVVIDPNGYTSILFSFVAMPALGAGVALNVWTLLKGGT